MLDTELYCIKFPLVHSSAFNSSMSIPVHSGTLINRLYINLWNVEVTGNWSRATTAANIV